MCWCARYCTRMKTPGTNLAVAQAHKGCSSIHPPTSTPPAQSHSHAVEHDCYDTPTNPHAERKRPKPLHLTPPVTRHSSQSDSQFPSEMQAHSSAAAARLTACASAHPASAYANCSVHEAHLDTCVHTPRSSTLNKAAGHTRLGSHTLHLLACPQTTPHRSRLTPAAHHNASHTMTLQAASMQH